jgi:hypothetical protein
MTAQPDGIDISRHQPTTPALTGLSFAFARATYGSYGDSKYAVHSAAFRAAGIVSGAYHFGRSTPSPEAQAAAFLKAAAGADLLALDLESDGGNVPMSAAQARAFIAAVRAAGRKIGLYHSRSGFPSLGQDWNWVAKWGSSAPTGIPWAFWQWQGSPLDRNRFNGTLADLSQLAGQPKESNVLLKANAASPVQTLVDVKKDGQVYRLDGTPLIKWSANYTVTSLGGSGLYDIVVVTTGNVTQYALILTSATTNRRPVGTTSVPAPVPAPVPPAPVIPPISTTPTHIAARQRNPLDPAGFWTANWAPDRSAWIASGVSGQPVCLLIHGGPIAADSLGGVDNLAGSLATAGAKGIALQYPTQNTTLAAAMAPLRAAVTQYKPSVIVAHSLGGYFGGILAAETGLPLVMVATDDLPNDIYRNALGGPVGRAALLASKVRVTVITGSLDPVATVAEHQALVADLAASGHPGRWIVIDGANHSSILSDTGTIAAIQGG